MAIFWSNGLVGGICALALLMLFWPLIGAARGRLRRARAAATPQERPVE
jgi:putative tricarboxylic transport membrane protein